MKIDRRRYAVLACTVLALCGSALAQGATYDGDVAKSREEPYSGIKSSPVGTQHAPVDGKDGIPHDGPWVETNAERERKKAKTLLDDDDDTNADGVVTTTTESKFGSSKEKIPQSNEGVMDDKSRSGPVEGTRGTEGGISEKSKSKDTISIDSKKPDAPKEARPLPHSEKEIMKVADATTSDDSSTSLGEDDGPLSRANTLSKPTDLPDYDYDKASLKDSKDTYASKPLGSPSDKSPLSDPSTKPADDIVQPLHSLFLAFTMIIFSEIGDKTFLVACLMAMRHDRLLVFSAAISALIVMTILSAVLGHAVPTLIPKWLTNFLAAGLFLVFGVKMLIEARGISPDEGVSEEMKEVEMELEEKEHQALRRSRRRSSISPYVLESGRGVPRKSRSEATGGRLPSPPESPTSSRSSSRAGSPSRGSTLKSIMGGCENLFSLLLSPAWVQTFVMTFLGEWGDRSQIATIAMAAGSDYIWVMFGSFLGHSLCTGMAVIGGKAIAGKVSLRTVTMGGAFAFLVFGVIYLLEALY